MRHAFTLVELIFVLVIISILSTGSFKMIEVLYIRSAKAKALTDLSLQSQIVLDQLSGMLYHRIPNSVIGYDPGGDCTHIDNLLNNDNSVLEWLALADEELLLGEYDGFVDMNASVNPIISTPSSSIMDTSNLNLIFAGAFDGGAEDIEACSGAFGWHGNDSNVSYAIDMSVLNQITFTDAVKQPDFIYEKYYLANGAYAVVRGEDIDRTVTCITDLNITVNTDTLFLFYEYYPYNGETFCADPSGNQQGEVTILAQDITAFSAESVNDIIRLSIDMEREIRGTSCGVHVSKQKGVF